MMVTVNLLSRYTHNLISVVASIAVAVLLWLLPARVVCKAVVQHADSATQSSARHCSCGPQGRHWALQCQPKAGTGWHWALQCQPKAGTGQNWALQCHSPARHWPPVRPPDAPCPPLFSLKLLSNHSENGLHPTCTLPKANHDLGSPKQTLFDPTIPQFCLNYDLRGPLWRGTGRHWALQCRPNLGTGPALGTECQLQSRHWHRSAGRECNTPGPSLALSACWVSTRGVSGRRFLW